MTEASWRDDAIAERSQDTLGRAAYADAAADLIARSHSWDSSLVFGLTGPWGSGKSSIIAMITERLQEQHKNWAVARFTPWAASDITGLLGDFYASLARALPTKRGIDIRRSFGKLASISAPAASLIPLAGGVAEQAMKMAGEALSATPSWDASFREASQRMKELGAPVLVIADDIDRLQPDELLAFLKVVRLLGRFPGVQYLLAYDEQTLFGRLDVSGGIATYGSDYMEKIVQYPLTVPPLLEYQVVARINTGLSRVFAETERHPLTSAQTSSTNKLVRSHLRTPRAIDRFLAQLRHHLPMVSENEIDDGDVVLLTLVRVQYPSIYRELTKWESELTTGHTDQFASSPGAGVQFEPFDVHRLMDGLSAAEQENAVELLEALFPKLHDQGASMPPGRRIANSAYFDRYFSMGIPDHDVSDATVELALNEARAGHGERLERLLKDENQDRAYLAAEKARGHSLNNWSVGDLLSLASSLSGYLEELPDKSSLFFSTREQAIIWLGSIIGTIPAEADSLDVLSALYGLQPATRFQVLQRVSHYMKQQSTSTHWYDVMKKKYGQEAMALFIHHLERGDQADDAPTAYFASFAIDQGLGDSLKAKIQELLLSNKVKLEDVAARTIALRRMIAESAEWELGDPSQDIWNGIAPNSDDAWYELPREANVDVTDTSWPNRRKYARGRFHPPNNSSAQDII